MFDVRVEFNAPGGIPFTFAPGMHYNYGEFLPACFKFMTPEQYVGRFFSSTKVKAEVTCQKCKEWIHA